MASFRAPYLYTETRLYLDPSHAGSTINLTLSKTGSHDRQLKSDVHIQKDEAQFVQEHVASDASLVFRSDERYPRSFLWRLLDDRRVLEVQAVDLSQDSRQEIEPMLTLLLRFPAAIRPFCLAFADAVDKDALNVFAITTSDELWTLTLHRDYFFHAKATEALTPDFCKVSKPSMFAVTTPFRLFSSGARELFVSMIDGQVVRLTRRAGGDGSTWHDAIYSEGKWGASLARSFKWRSGPTVRFGGLDLDPSAAISVAPTSFDEDDAHLVTVCLNHTLRIWNLKTGRISSEIDILGEEDQKYLIAANQRQLLQVVDMPARQEFYAVTYSPKHHQFKFWAIFDAEAGRQGIREMRPEIEYKPPIEMLMNTAVWNLEEFHLRPSRGGLQTELWLRVRSGQTSRAFKLKFDPFDFGHKLHEVDSREVKECWAQDWEAVHPGRQTLEQLDLGSPAKALETLTDTEVPEITERWLSYLFHPGRFTTPLLEAALTTYSAAAGLTTWSSKAPLKDRVTKAIWSSAAKPSPRTHASVDQDMKTKWQTFYSIVRDLHKRRSEVLSFTIDPEDQLPWLIAADFIAPIRDCSRLEKVDMNAAIASSLATPKLAFYSIEQGDDESVSEAVEAEGDTMIGNLFLVAHSLRASFPVSFQESLKRHLTNILIEDPIISVKDQIHALQKETSIFEHMSEDDESRFDNLVTDFGGFRIFHLEIFTELLRNFTEQQQGRSQEEHITRYGSRQLIRASQEMVALNTEILLDLLVMVLYLEGSFEEDELLSAIKGLPEDAVDTMDVDSVTFNAQDIYTQIMDRLHEEILLEFLLSNTRTERVSTRRKSIGDSPETRREAKEHTSYSSTLLSSMFVGDWENVKAPEEGMSPTALSTYMTRAWLSQLHADQFDSFSAHVLADLIKHGDTGLGNEFLPFVPLTGWSSYLRARLCLDTNSLDQAKEWFKKSAYSMSLGVFDAGNEDSAGLLRPDQIDKFSDGLPAYYEHVMDLLGQLKAGAHVADFAQLALQAHDSAYEAAHGQNAVSAIQITDKDRSNYEKRRLDLLSRLFTSSLQCDRHDDAYIALMRMSPVPMRHFYLSQFIKVLVEQHQVKKLFAYPWAQLADDADAELDKQAKKVLSLSSKPEYHKVLYAWRIKRGNYRGAAQAAFDRLERLRSEIRSKGEGPDPRDERLGEAYLLLINAMACVGQSEAWVVREPVVGMKGLINGTEKEKKEGKRSLVTLEDVRREYQEELDRMAALEQGRFSFMDAGAGRGEPMEVL